MLDVLLLGVVGAQLTSCAYLHLCLGYMSQVWWAQNIRQPLLAGATGCGIPVLGIAPALYLPPGPEIG